MNQAKRVLAAGLFCLSFGSPLRGAEVVYDVGHFGAVPDGETLCTEAIQKAVDACAAGGGGTVRFPAGTFLSGTIFLKSHVSLWLDAGATLKGSPNGEHYPQNPPAVRSYTDNYVSQSLIAGEDLEHVAIRGRGTIDGSGSAFRWRQYKNRPYVIRLVNCRDVLVEGITLKNSPMWMQHYLACQRLTVRGITVWNHVSFNNDGLNVDGCRDVCISGCTIDSDDDALCLKSTLNRPCENVTITGCVLSSHCNAIKTGTESNGGFQNITIANCTICSPRYSKSIYGAQRGLAGIALEIVDGGHLDRVAISNVAIKGVTVPIFMRLGNRARPFQKDAPKPDVGTFRNVVVTNVVATDTGPIGCSITGLPGHPVQNVSLGNLRLEFAGGGVREQTLQEVPEKEESYPESTMFGALPAYGLYVRHAKGVKLVDVELGTVEPDRRHAILCDDVDDVVVDGLGAQGSPDAAAMIRLINTRGALIRGCRAGGIVDLFLDVSGKTSERVMLVGNDLSRVSDVVQAAGEVPDDALFQASNFTSRRDGRQ
ncbi:MAG: glycoside hydrolase family 28 protein [Planctomycetota bacterium]|jgi:polygalacturonase